MVLLVLENQYDAVN